MSFTFPGWLSQPTSPVAVVGVLGTAANHSPRTDGGFGRARSPWRRSVQQHWPGHWPLPP
jgi:hypothetical protein